MLLDAGPGGQWVAEAISGAQLAAPSLLPFECSNIIRRHELAGLVSADQAAQAHADLLALPVEHWPYELLGAGYSILGVAFIYCGHRRQREVEDAVQRGEWAPLDVRITAALTLAGILLGLVTVIVVLAGV